MPLTAQAEGQVKAILDACTDPASGTGIPGLVFCAIDKSGKYLTQQASGNIGLEDKTPMDMETVFWIASCTKIVTGIACMQLVEQGRVDLDSSDQLYKICPELKDVQVLNESGRLEPKQKEITLRMLLTHTAGFGHSFTSEKLCNYQGGFNELSGDAKEFLTQPLINQPGSMWEYGLNIDWVGIAVERVSGMTIDDYFQKNIFKPLGIKNAGFFPNDYMKEHMAKSHQRDSKGAHQTAEYSYSMPFHATDKSKAYQTAGAGLYAQPAEYCLLLAALLNDGTSPNTGEKILEKKTVDEMFTNQIPQFPDFARRPIVPTKPELINYVPELYPQEGNPPQGWGLTFCITIEPAFTGRGPNTGFWSGIVNLFYWVDRAKGVAGMIAAQILPAGDQAVGETWIGCEKAVYDGLE